MAVLQAIQNAETAPEISLEDLLWVGGQGGMEKELVERAGVSYVEIPAAGVHGVGLRALPGNV
ncbi:MAG: UDP-N-acetylglucosamine--N-acetylmuramyl-(pentapeptide) pyrophosphoryl-undecaprenol N-acetylglucosamine transferase, partial [Chloroflexota bacterium]|nr:UDP-N-acetylglucosamine--N-acetylmuramyl-(pentapeptide) pyrophosphoryl-undecaprenol N-acetylglucosamine transferase [Chloroflexota bacterium]